MKMVEIFFINNNVKNTLHYLLLTYNKSMTELQEIGQTIKQSRLAMNLRMDDVAREANISRVTLYNIEKGTDNYSISSLMNVLKVLDLYMKLNNGNINSQKRERATRGISIHDKKVNRFVVMCVEMYAASVNQASETVYKEMNEKGVISYLIKDYEDLHGMSTPFLNQFIDGLLEE